MPAWERPYWEAWLHIEPTGWDADNLNTARISRWLAVFSGRARDASIEQFLLPPLTLGAFDPEIRAQEEQEREIKKLESILRDDLGNRT